VGVSLAILTRKNRLRPSRTPCSACFIRSRSGIANSFKTKGPARGAPISQRYDAIMATLQLLSTQFPPAQPAGVRAMAATRRPAPHPRKYQTDRVRNNRLTRALPS
jgi:hypothetical protein